VTPIRVLLVDDHAVVREGLRLVLGQEEGLAVVGEAADPREAVELSRRQQPDVVVMDIGLGNDDGVGTIAAILAQAPDTRILVLTMFHDPETLRQCLLAGAAGFVVKGASAAEVVDAIRAVHRGERYVHSSVAGFIVEDGLHWLRDGSVLSRREREVLGLLGGGRTPAGIGEVLGISVHTVRRHLANTATKLGLVGARELARYAREHDLARPAEPVRAGAIEGLA
jgi:NarL family two-component system response regulator LiaR